jgi:signal transduction histidine kinase
VTAKDIIPVEGLVQEAYEEAKKYQPVRATHLTYENGAQPAMVSGDRDALKHALTEVLINALQANPVEALIGVRTQTDAEGNGNRGVAIEVQDNGTGFSPELIERLPEPFFTTRNVGLGLGLAVSRKIIQTHHGKLALTNAPGGHAGVVRISLPAASPPAQNQ